tara:strand:- start:194 stop:817 length:624 start_codon:yes stop_codon:yes gene_type:complete
MIKIMDDRLGQQNKKIEAFTTQPPIPIVPNLIEKLESLTLYKPKKITKPTKVLDYRPVKTCAIDLVQKQNQKQNQKQKQNQNETDPSKSSIDTYYQKKPRDTYVGLYQNRYQQYLKTNHKESFPYLSSNTETLEQNYTHFKELDIPPTFLAKGSSTNIKPQNYYKPKRALKRNNNRYDKLPSRKKRKPRFKCQRTYEVCDTAHVPLD